MVKMVDGENANVVKRFSWFSEWIPNVQKRANIVDLDIAERLQM